MADIKTTKEADAKREEFIKQSMEKGLEEAAAAFDVKNVDDKDFVKS